MDVFLSLFANIAPLYVIIALGWIAGRFYDVRKESLSALAIYIIVPIVAFYYVAGIDFRAAYIALPFIVYAVYCGMTFIFFTLGKKLYPDKRANLLAMCCSASNTGYLGLPIVILLFPPEWVGVYVFALLGGLFYEATFMYYIANRGHFTPADSLRRVLKFPVLYAVLAGLLVNAVNAGLPAQLGPFWNYFKGAYVVIGMMIIGVSLAKVARLVIAPKFLALVFAAQFLVWPLAALGVIALDRAALHWFAPEIHDMLLVISVMPPAANIAAFAAQLDLNPEKAASTVLLTTIFALFYIPLALSVFGIS